MTTPENPSAQTPPPSPDAPTGYAPPGVPYPRPEASYEYAGQPMPGVPSSDRYGAPTGPLGQIRPTGLTMLLFFVTLGIWGFVYYYQVQEELKRHSGEGLGGPLALVIAIFAGIVSPFILSHEAGMLYERRGQLAPVSAMTGLWFFPGMLILVGPFIWFVKTNDAINDYWRSLGVR